MTKDFFLDQLIMTGFDYKNSPVEIREKVSFTRDNIEKAYKKLKLEGKVKEAVILSTCNRSEIYVVIDGYELCHCVNRHSRCHCVNSESEKYLKNFYAEFFNIDKSILNDYIIFRSSNTTITHIFEVACGFQSMVLGEDQILGQVKYSYEKALEHDSTGKVLNQLFIDSITTAKKIKALTGISENPLSLSYIGIKLIEQKLNCLEGKKALVIGLGKMSRISVQNMLDKQMRKIYVTNRTRRKITDFTKEFSGIEELDFKNRYEAIENVDIIISCTAAPHFILNKEKFVQYYKNKPLYILDLAIPRDIDPSIQDIKGVQLYRLDDLEEIARKNIEKRFQARDQGLIIIDQAIKKYIEWVQESRIIDLIMLIQKNSKKIIVKELEQLRKKLGKIDENQMSLIERSFYNVAKSFAHQPMIKLKEIIKENHEYKDSLSKLFEEEQ